MATIKIKIIDEKKEFSDLSYSITKKLTNKQKKENGIFFTPSGIINKMISFIKDIENVNIINILEPSCGSCEIIKKVLKNFDNANIDGIEFNDVVYENIKNIKFKNKNKNKVSITNADFLKFENDIKYDLIIGNPPYFVMSKKTVDKKYYKYFDGRPNIFILFIIKSLEKINENGILSFVLPTNFMNCIYYSKLREHIYKNYKILKIENCFESSYIETKQDTCIFIIQNKTPICQILSTNTNNYFTIIKNNITIFNEINNIKKLNELYNNSTTINNLGFDVKVGSIVWNQVKNKLTTDETKTRLIYSSDIDNGVLDYKKYKNPDKKNYINENGITNITLVINRGYGKGKYKFNYCLINENKKEYLLENHLIHVKSRIELDDIKLLQKYNIIVESFKNNKTKSFIKLYFGNNAINTKELQHILPIYE
jgi:thiol-disulfide isomerase/thioredoxin